jgi:hypothetical protein
MSNSGGKCPRYALGKPKGGACFWAQVEQGDRMAPDYTGQEELHKTIWNSIHWRRFYLAKLAPLCQQPLQGSGYNAICQTSRETLNGTYKNPQDFEEATKEILQECLLICLKVSESLVDTLITKDVWGNHWGKAREETYSLAFWRHFSHYKAGLCLAHISHLQALFASLIIKWGLVHDRWSQGLFIMLEKIFGCNLITKLQFILLMEANFNATNKTVYGIRMLANVRKYKLMLEEVFSECNCLAKNEMLSKVLFYDIVRQLCRSAGLASFDADDCYNRITHPMAFMIFQVFGAPTKAITLMLSTIQRMQFFLCTGYGDSKKYAGVTKKVWAIQSGHRVCARAAGCLLLPGWSQVFL